MATAATEDIAMDQRRIVRERIGDQYWDIQEATLDVYDDLMLWTQNPRLTTLLSGLNEPTEIQLEAKLQLTNGYDGLRKSIENIGQMEPIYVWRANAHGKYLVLEGATRVTVLRELDKKHVKGEREGLFRQAKVKILPSTFSARDRTILLARIHVRGSGVRSWGRFIEAGFIYKAVVGEVGQAPEMNVTQMANYMEKSVSWVQRLRDAYQFALKFIEHVDTEDADRLAGDNFSVLEELSKARVIGSQLRDYENTDHDHLRSEVFEMVENEAFKEYRDARFLKDFHDDPDKWEQLKSGEKHIASKLALEIKANISSPRAKIAEIPKLVKRTIDRGEIELGEEDMDALQSAITEIGNVLHEGVRPFRVALRNMTTLLSEASRADVMAVDPHELREFREALEYFDDLMTRYGR